MRSPLILIWLALHTRDGYYLRCRHRSLNTVFEIVLEKNSENVLGQAVRHCFKQYIKISKQNILININKYIVKYDFDIADKLKCNPRNRTEQMEGDFKRAAIYEILHICSLELAQHKKTFNSMWTFNGA